MSCLTIIIRGEKLMEFKKNELINATLDRFFETWQHTQDTADFVDEKFLKKVDKYIFKNMRKRLKQIDVYYLLYLKDKGVKLSLFNKLKVWISDATPIYKAEQNELKRLAEEKRKKQEEKLLDKKKRKRSR